MIPGPVSPAMSDEAQAGLLLEQTADVSRLNSSQVEQLVSNLEDLVAGPRISVALGNITVHIVSNLLGASETTLASSSNQYVATLSDATLSDFVLSNKLPGGSKN